MATLEWVMCSQCKKNKREVSNVDGQMLAFCVECNEEIEAVQAANPNGWHKTEQPNEN